MPKSYYLNIILSRPLKALLDEARLNKQMIFTSNDIILIFFPVKHISFCKLLWNDETFLPHRFINIFHLLSSYTNTTIQYSNYLGTLSFYMMTAVTTLYALMYEMCLDVGIF